MKKFWQNYKSTILLLAGVIIGGLLGFYCPAVVPWLKPVGDIFLNLMFVLIVPMVFLSMASSICTLHKGNMVGNVLGKSLIYFVVVAIITALLTYWGCRIYLPLDISSDFSHFANREAQDIGALISGALTVSDFWMLLDKQHLLPLIVMAILTGFAVAKSGEKGERMAEWIYSANAVVMQLVKMIMVVAPIGLGCYFAVVMSQMGGQLVSGYARTVALCLVLTSILYFILNPLIILLLHGKAHLKAYFTHLLPPSVMAIATCSSSATMPVSIESTKQMGVDERIADAVIPLGSNLFKQGSIMTGTIKVVFAMLLSGMALQGPTAWLTIMLVAIVAACVVSAVPSGAMTGELFICAMLGVDPQIVGMLVVIATLLDMPGTLLNATGNVTAAAAIGMKKDNK